MRATSGLACLALTAVLGALSAPVAAQQQTFYLFDGDHQKAVAIQGGAVIGSFNTFSIGYAPAITDTIWLGDRDNRGAIEFNLDGTSTGSTSAGGAFISQLLDGTTDGIHNYGITCCSSSNINQVTVANSDWTGQTTLFTFSGQGVGITYDTDTSSLYAILNGNEIVNYSLGGSVLGTFSVGGYLAALAYEQSTGTLWGWNRSTSSLQQYSTSGTLLQSLAINVSNYGISNPWGGEMAIGSVPEPSTWAMMLIGFGGIGFVMRRKHSGRAVEIA